MAETSIFNWFLEQAPVIFVMGVGIFWLAKLYISERNYNKELSNKAVELAKESMNELVEIGKFKTQIIDKLNDFEAFIRKNNEK